MQPPHVIYITAFHISTEKTYSKSTKTNIKGRKNIGLPKKYF